MVSENVENLLLALAKLLSYNINSIWSNATVE